MREGGGGVPVRRGRVWCTSEEREGWRGGVPVRRV